MNLNKKDKFLIIVESPEKSRHISKIFKDAGYNNVAVHATIGHFTKIADGSGYWNTGIHPDNNFAIDYVIDTGKKENIDKLKFLVKASDFIFVASDSDREGEAIAWSCIKFLNIPKSKSARITYHEITKKAIFEAIEKAHSLDENLVNAAHSRSCLDKMMGYRLSPIARNMVNCKSVGRCQSAGLKLIVDREDEIKAFVPEKYYDLFLHFIKNNKEFRAKYLGTLTKNISKIPDEKYIQNIYNECKGNNFIVSSVTHKNKNENPKPPFCTATFQQECANKLGLSIKQATDCAQKLFESGKISYHRTDDETMDEGFAKELQAFVRDKYGKEYLGELRKGKKDESDQNGHECLRVLDLDLTPELLQKNVNSDLLAKVYRIIYNRTIACTMKPAIIAETTYVITNNNSRFGMVSNELLFDGYRKAYAYKDDNDDGDTLIKETFNENEILEKCSFESVPKQTTPPARYKEATFLKELKDKGIGRPSTYATIVETILSESRGYCELKGKEITPTEKGITLSHFLNEKFPDIININYTRDMEKDLDLIANNKLDYIDFLNKFYNNLEGSVGKVDSSGNSINSNEKVVCPNCGKEMKLRKGKFGLFWGCSGYPECKTILPLKKKN